MLIEGFKMIQVSHMYPHLLLSICSSGKLGWAVRNSSAAVTSSGKQQKMGKYMGSNPPLPSSERSQEMHDSWQLCAGMGGGMCTEWTQSQALFRQDGLRRPKVHADTNSENHSCSGSQSWENKSLLNFWLYMALVYSMSQLPWGWKGLSWPLFSTSCKLRALKIKFEVKQNPGHNFLTQWNILFFLEVSTCPPTSSLQLGKMVFVLLGCLCQPMWLFLWSEYRRWVLSSIPLISGYAQWIKGELAADNKTCSSCCEASTFYWP